MNTDTRASHTRGPWTYDYSPNHTGIHPSFLVLAPDVTVVAEVARDPERGVIGSEVEANARLIAAGPDLLLACRAAVWALTPAPLRSHYGNDQRRADADNAFEALKAAIAKAEGRGQ